MNDNLQVTGYCVDGAFVRQADGTLTILAALGTNAIGFGVAKNGTVGGQYCAFNPVTFGCDTHGFTWHPSVGYKTIDYVDPRPGTHTRSIIIAPVSNGKSLGEYYVDDGVKYIEHGYYVHDNGTFTTFPNLLSFEHIGGQGVFITDWNEFEQFIVQRWNSGANDGLELCDDGKCYKITGIPAGWRIQQIGGLNDLTQFVGQYSIQVGVDPAHGNAPIFESHGFVATPAPLIADRKVK
jgi:hypothetical protein